MRPRSLGAAVLASAFLAAGCADAGAGAALVRGGFVRGVGMAFAGSANIHGAGPFLVKIRGDLAGASGGDRAGIFIEIEQPRIPEDGETIAVGPDQLARARLRVIRTVEAADYPVAWGADATLEDGSFVVGASSGAATVHLGGRRPGDGVWGDFALSFPGPAGAETVTGSFAGALND